jgi:hypothetical protein
MRQLTSWATLAAAGIAWSLVSCDSSPPSAPPAPPPDTFAVRRTLDPPRIEFAAAQLQDGRILIAGGFQWIPIDTVTPPVLASALLYDPANDSLTPTQCEMNLHRVRAKGVTLRNGSVMIVGGDSTALYTILQTEIYDPATGCFTPGPSLQEHSSSVQSALLLPDGRVLVLEVGAPFAGGAELYDPAADTFRVLDRNLGTFRELGTPTLLPSGQVLITGGTISTSGFVTTTDRALLFDPATETFRELSARLHVPREFHVAAVEPSGRVLIAGGTPLSSAATMEEYDPATEQFVFLGSRLVDPRVVAASVTLLDGRIAIVGGKPGFGRPGLRDVELFDPVSKTTEVAAVTVQPMPGDHVAFLTRDGVVVVVRSAGDPIRDSLSDIEVYRPHE